MIIKDRLLLIITGIIFIAVVITSLLITGMVSQKGGTTQIDKPTVYVTLVTVTINSSLIDFPPEIQGEIQTLSDKYSITPDYWGFDPFNNEIDLLEQDVPNTSAYKDLSGKKIGNFTVHIFNSTEIEATRSEVEAWISPLMFSPEYQITNSMTGGDFYGRPTIDLECEKFTPENKKLENLVYKGWRIRVNVCCGVPGITTTP